MRGENLRVLRQKVLSDCKPEFAFWSCNGTIIRNIYELRDYIRDSDDWSFRYHVNEDNNKNDFVKWIREVLADNKLSKSLEGVIDKKRYIKTLERRIKQLESA